MEAILQTLSQPWHWSLSGAMITLTMFLLLMLGREFGISSNYRTICTLSGAGRRYTFFDIDLREQLWNLYFVAGMALGGYLAVHYLASPEPPDLSCGTIEHLTSLGISLPAQQNGPLNFIPKDLFGAAALLTPRGLLLTAGGGFIMGFGARWGGGCTSGHGVSGLSNLQPSSLIAVIGFFAGGWLVSTYLLPIIFTL